MSFENPHRVCFTSLNNVLTIRFYHLGRYPEQPWFLHKFTEGCLGLVAFIQRWFLLPRSHPKLPIKIKLPKVDDKVRSPRLHPNE